MERQERFEREKKLRLEAAIQAIGIPRFERIDLLEIALTHPSYVYEKLETSTTQKNEQEREYRRLAHLGDAILNAIVTDYLYKNLPDLNQGQLTTTRQNIVNKPNLFKLANKFQLKQFCFLGMGEQGNSQTKQERLFSEMLEALLGAIYLEFDRDFSKTRTWLVDRYIANAVDDFFDK